MKHKLINIRNASRSLFTSDELRKNKEQTQGKQLQNHATIQEVSHDDGPMGQLIGIFKAILKETVKQKSSRQAPHLYQLQARDREVLIPLPQIVNNRIKPSDLKTWISSVLKKVCSAAFKSYFKSQMNYEQTKIFCSQNIFKNIVLLSKQYRISSEQMQLIDQHIKYGVLNYLAAKFPLTDSTEINKKLQQAVHEVDNIQSLDNNYFTTSSFIFQYRDNGNYNDLIMRFLNDLMDAIDKSSEEEQMSTFEDFEEFMSSLFEKVEDEEWMRKEDKNMYLSGLKLSHKQSEMNSPDNISSKLHKDQKDVHEIETLKEKARRVVEEKEKYKSKVKQYTHYLIGRKIPENTRVFSGAEIENGHITIKSPTILRILTKWCEQLHEKFKNNYFSNRSESVKLQRGNNINSLLAWMRKNIDDRLSVQLKSINSEMSELFKNNYEIQSEILQKQTFLSGDEFIDKVQKASGKFSFKVVKNLHVYIITYLNRLLHGLLKVSKEFHEEGGIADYFLWPYPPNLLTFKIGDLLRCKCSSKQKQILKIYKEIQRISRENPEKLKIVRIKNRLRSGTNDILMNLRFNNKIICQVQLAIKSRVSDFIKCSNLFHHYLYQLQRSVFGPLTELCSIWISLDSRSNLYEGLVQEQMFLTVQQTEHTCPKLRRKFKMVKEEKPFICSRCSHTYFHSNYIKDHLKCNLCSYTLCAYCVLDILSEQQLKKEVVISEQLRNHIARRIGAKDLIPNCGICISIESMQAKCQLFTQIKYQNKIYLMSKKGEQFYEIFNINSKKHSQVFKKKYLIFDLVLDRPYRLNKDQVIKRYILPAKLRESFVKEKQSISLMDLGLTSEECNDILAVGQKGKKENVKSLFLVDNSLEYIPGNLVDFANLNWLTLSRNKVRSFKGIDQLKHLKRLTCLSGQIEQFPQEFYSCHSLTYLDIPYNLISSIDDRISNLVKLEVLQLTSNALTSLPPALFDCITLKTLKIDSNQIAELPEAIGRLQNLQKLSLSSNYFSIIPDSIGSLVKLKQLLLASLSNIQALPLTLNNLTEIEMFDISHSQVSTIPLPEQGWKKLKHLNIQNVPLKQIPIQFAQCNNLQIIFLNSTDNIFFPDNFKYEKLRILEMKTLQNTTETPYYLKYLTNLESLDFTYNTFAQKDFCSKLKNLKSITINECYLGFLPDFSFCKKLKKISATNNSITSIEQASLQDLNELSQINLSSNSLSELPSIFRNFKKLMRLDLRSNCISRLFDEQTQNKIKQEKTGWPNIKQIFLSTNTLTEVPPIIYYSPKLDNIFLTSTQIQLIGPEIKNLKNLKQIQMNYTPLKEIPKELFEIETIQNLYLSCNQIKVIPLEVKNFKKIAHFYVDYNPIEKIDCYQWVLDCPSDIILGTLPQKVEQLMAAQIPPPQVVNDNAQTVQQPIQNSQEQANNIAWQEANDKPQEL